MSPTTILGWWLALSVVTGASWWLGERGSHLSGPLAAAVFALALFKGAVVVLEFMELRHAPPLWRRLLLGWLVGVVALLLVLRGLG